MTGNTCLYKYRSWPNLHSERMLIHCEVRFAGYNEFNDPFDCRIPIRWDLLTNNELREFAIRNGSQEPDAWVANFRTNPDFQLSVRRQEMEDNLKEFGMFCLSANCTSLLMWSHYASQHKGVCIGFDRNLLEAYCETIAVDGILIDTLPIHYQTSFPLIIPNDTLTDEQRAHYQFQFKSSVWEYEKEVRYLRWGAPANLTLPAGIISEVILGCDMPDHERINICDMLRKSANRIRVFQAARQKEAFALDFEEITI